MNFFSRQFYQHVFPYVARYYPDATPELVSVHIPKTAGTSFRLILERTYGKRKVIRLDKPIGGKVTKVEEKVYDKAMLPSRARVIHGHFNPVEIRKRFPQIQWQPFITWLRDPVDRVISNYFYYEGQLDRMVDKAGFGRHVATTLKRNLLEFARDPKNQNLQHRFLDGMPLEDFTFVGIQEHYAEDLAELARRFKWEDDTVIKVNVTKGERPVITEETRQEIARLNHLDMDLYRRGLEMRARRRGEVRLELISLHIPKTAGTSLYHTLKEVYGHRVQFPYRRIHAREIHRKHADFSESLVPEKSIIHGHLYFEEVARAHDLYGGKVICWVRHPVDRVISNYNFWITRLRNNKRHIRVGYKRNQHRRNETLEEYIERPGTRNMMTRYLKGIALEDLFFIGRTEKYAEDLQRLADKLGWPEVNAQRLNTSSENKAVKSPVSAATRERIETLNSEDMVLYEAALKLIDQRIHSRR